MECNLIGLKHTKEFKFEKNYIISYKENKNQATPSEEPDFDILSSSKEITSHEYNLVDKGYLISKSKDESSYIDKYILNFKFNGKNFIVFPKEATVLEIDDPNKNKIQECNEIPSLSQNENKNENKFPKEKGKNRIRNLIQLYKEEMEIFTLFDKNINNEKDMKEYYLINKNWMNLYKENSNYKKIEEIILKDKKNLNEEEFLRSNYEGVSNEIKDLPENLLKEENFIPQSKLDFLNIEESKDLFCPHEFVLVSDRL